MFISLQNTKFYLAGIKVTRIHFPSENALVTGTGWVCSGDLHRKFYTSGRILFQLIEARLMVNRALGLHFEIQSRKNSLFSIYKTLT